VMGADPGGSVSGSFNRGRSLSPDHSRRVTIPGRPGDRGFDSIEGYEMRKLVLLLWLIVPASSVAAGSPEPTQADHVLRDFRFASGETLPELRIHYRTLGTPRQDRDGKVVNAVLILHGTTGSDANFIRPEFAGELFGEGQPLDASRYFLILPDGIGEEYRSSDGATGDELDLRQRALLPRQAGRGDLRARGREVGRLPTHICGDRLGRAIAKLKAKQPLTIAVSGDSISEGYNATGFTKTPPFQPPYPNLVAAQLEATCGSKVTLHNLAVGGWSSRQGVNDLDRLLATKPDLVLIAYGMNDVGGRDPKAFRANIEAMLRRIREANPATEMILVAPMTGNPDWMATPPEMFPLYRDALASLEGPGVVLADLTSIWLRLIERKRHLDLTGNGVNHPNDYGHRVYAQAILALLVDPDLIPRRAGSDR
jgi:lysophospholipase L1-like esterase